MGRVLYSQYDELNRPLVSQNYDLATSTMTYDTNGDLVSLIESDGEVQRESSFEYDINGYVSRSIASDGQIKVFENDEFGRVLKESDEEGNSIVYTYSGEGQLTSITNKKGYLHSFDLNLWGLADNYISPLADSTSSETQFNYDLDKRMSEIIYPSGESLAMSYVSGSDRVSHITTSDDLIVYSYNDDGQVSNVINAAGINVSSGYDGNLLISQSGSGIFNWSLVLTHNDDLNIRSIGASGNYTSYSFNNDDQIISAGSQSYTYNEENPLLASTALGNLTEEYSYNGFGELVSFEASNSGATLYSVSIERDSAGRITSRSENGTLSLYNYDDEGQLIEVDRDGEVVNHTYDLNGNRVGVTKNLQTESATFDEQDRLLTQGDLSFDYDDNGYTTKIINSESDQEEEAIFDYDLRGNLLSVTLRDTLIEYAVDPLNRRIAKYKDEEFVEGYIYKDQLNPVAKVDNSGSVTEIYAYASKEHVPDYMSKDGVNYKFITDERGSVRMVVNSSTGEVVQEISYDAFGQVLSDTNPGFQPFGFAGGLYDPDTNLVRFGARDYNPVTGRWMAKDPIGFNGGDTNLYRYSYNEPINYIDPKGTISTRSAFMCLASLVIGKGVDVYLVFSRQNEIDDRYEDALAGLNGGASGGDGSPGGSGGGAGGSGGGSASCEKEDSSSRNIRSDVDKQKLLDEYQRESLKNMGTVYTPDIGTYGAAIACLGLVTKF